MYGCNICSGEYTYEEMALRDDKPTKFCKECASMISNTAKKRDAEVGSGPIAIYEEGTKNWVRLEPQWEQAYLLSEATPKWDYHSEGEYEFTEVDLVKLSTSRVWRRLTKMGWTDVEFYVVEDIAGAVVVEFLEAIDRGTPIRSIHGWHWGLVNHAVAQWMEEKIRIRQASIPIDVLDWASVNNIRTPSNIGAAMSLSDHEKMSPDWTRVDVDGMRVYLTGEGLTNKEVSTLINALKGENFGFHGKKSTRVKLASIAKKLKGREVTAYNKLHKFLERGA